MYGFKSVWARTSPEVQASLVSVLDNSSRYELVCRAEKLHPAMEARSLQHGDAYELESLARRPVLDPKTLLKLSKDRRKGVTQVLVGRDDLDLEHLVNLHGCDDPELNARLFAHPRTSPELRRLIAGGFSGKRNKGGERGVVALSYLLAQELEKPEHRELALESLDQNLVEHLLGVRSQLSHEQQVVLIQRIRALKHWRRLFLGAVGGWSGELGTFVGQAAQNESNDLDAFAAELAVVATGGRGAAESRPEIGPAQLIELARQPQGDHTQLLVAASVPWRGLSALLEEDAFPIGALGMVLNRDDVPEEFYERCFELDPNGLAQAAQLPTQWVLAAVAEHMALKGTSNLTLRSLPREEAQRIQRRRSGVRSILARHGDPEQGITLAQIIPLARPVSELPGLCQSLGSRRRGVEPWAELIHEHIAARLGENGTAWHTLHELLPSFGGDLDELLAVVEATQA